MDRFIQNHPGEQYPSPRPNPDRDSKGAPVLLAVLLVGIPTGIGVAVLKRLDAIGVIAHWVMYLTGGCLFLFCTALMVLIARSLPLKSVREQKKYYRLAGGLSWLPQEKREALQLDGPYCYHAGQWVETLEYWPCDIRLPRKTTFTTFRITTTEDRLVANDQAWGVLSEQSYEERVRSLFNGMHSQLFASDKLVMTEAEKKALVFRLRDLTQLPEAYIKSCWEPHGNKPPLLLWAFDLQRIVELSRTSFMAGLITEQQAWEQLLKASHYVHALFDNSDDFFNNYRLGHAYWSNDFGKTSEVSQMQKAYNNTCHWPIKEVPWIKQDPGILPEVIRNSCREFVTAALKRNTRNPIGFQAGDAHEASI